MENFRSKLYKLEGTKVVLADSLEDWAEHTGKTENVICHSNLENGVLISTAFLPIDHEFLPRIKTDKKYQPLVFETMVFGGKFDGYMDRYRTYEDAVEGHHKTLDMITEKKESEQNG